MTYRFSICPGLPSESEPGGAEVEQDSDLDSRGGEVVDELGFMPNVHRWRRVHELIGQDDRIYRMTG
jgi:hypothetical protein